MASATTKKFQELLQENYQSVLGEEMVSRALAWKIFKASIATVVQFLTSMVDPQVLQDVKLPLKGVGTFQLVFRKPRSVAGNKPALEGRTRLVPHLRWKPSSRFNRVLVKTFCGVDLPIPMSRSTHEKVKKRAAQRARKS